MKPKKLKKPVSKSLKDSFTPSQVGALIESFKSDFRLFGKKLESLENKVDGIAVNQTLTLERITALEIGQIRLLKKVDVLDKRVVAIEKEIKEIKAILKVKIDTTEFKNLEIRVSILERKLDVLIAK